MLQGTSPSGEHTVLVELHGYDPAPREKLTATVAATAPGHTGNRHFGVGNSIERRWPQLLVFSQVVQDKVFLLHARAQRCHTRKKPYAFSMCPPRDVPQTAMQERHEIGGA